MSVNVGQLVAQAWQDKVGTKPEDAIFDEYSELRRLEANALSRTGGRSLIGNIEYATNPTVGAITSTQTLSVTFSDSFDEWEAQWKQYGGTVPMSSFEQAVNRGSNAKFDLQAGKLENLQMTLRDTINADILGAASGNEMTGYQDLIPLDPTTGTVQGVNRGTYSFWRSQQTSGAKSSTAYDQLRAAMRTIRTSAAKGQGVKAPSRYLTDATTANGYESLLIANERIVDEKTNAKANAAFKGDVYKFGSANVYWDDDCTSGYMYAVQDNDPVLCYQAGYWFKGYPAVEPANQFIEVFKVECILQLVAKNPRHLGVVTGIT